MDKFISMDFKPDLRNIIWKKGWKNFPECYVKVKTPGVTSVINDMIPNPEIDEWIKAVGKETADKITQNAFWRGTAMHIFIENYLIEIQKSGDPSKALRYTQEISPPILKKEEKVPDYKINEGRDLFYKFINSDYSSDFSKLLGTEMKIYSPYLFFRGAIDWPFIHKTHGLSIRDFKTSSKPIKSGSRKEEGYKYQLGAYSIALEHMYKQDSKDIIVNYASIVSMPTRGEIVQNIECFGNELQEYKEKFTTLIKEWHIKHGQEFLIN